MSEPVENTSHERQNHNESAGERIGGLVPESLRKAISTVAKVTAAGVKKVCNASWMIFAVSLILFVPIIFEIERHHGTSFDFN